MPITHHEADRLFRAGEFSELLRLAEITPATARLTESSTRIILTHAAVMTGRLTLAKELVTLDSTPGTNVAIRSRAAGVLGLIDQAEGNIDSAVGHFQAAIRFARDSKEPERIAWAHLHLLRLLIDGHRTQAVTTLLPEARKVVTNAGLPHLSAYLHLSVSAFEGQTGRIGEAQRHCDIAESILRMSPNVWLSGIAWLIRGCIAYTMCDFSQACEHIERAKQTNITSGHDRIASALDNNLGHIETMMGRFQKARQTFNKIVNSAHVGALDVVGAFEGLARLHLALNELDDCEAALDRVDDEARRHQGLGSSYHARWASVTRARMLLKRGDPEAALHHLIPQIT